MLTETGGATLRWNEVPPSCVGTKRDGEAQRAEQTSDSAQRFPPCSCIVSASFVHARGIVPTYGSGCQCSWIHDLASSTLTLISPASFRLRFASNLLRAIKAVARQRQLEERGEGERASAKGEQQRMSMTRERTEDRAPALAAAPLFYSALFARPLSLVRCALF